MLLPLVLGCASPDPGLAPDLPASVTATLGPDGGELTTPDGLTLSLPDGALAEPTALTVHYDGELWHVAPEDLPLLRPAILCVPGDDPADEARLWWSTSDGLQPMSPAGAGTGTVCGEVVRLGAGALRETPGFSGRPTVALSTVLIEAYGDVLRWTTELEVSHPVGQIRIRGLFAEWPNGLRYELLSVDLPATDTCLVDDAWTLACAPIIDNVLERPPWIAYYAIDDDGEHSDLVVWTNPD